MNSERQMVVCELGRFRRPFRIKKDPELIQLATFTSKSDCEVQRTQVSSQFSNMLGYWGPDG